MTNPRGNITFTAAGQEFNVRPSFALIADLETAIGGPIELLHEEMLKPKPSIVTIGAAAVALLKHSDKAPSENEAQAIVLDRGAITWLVDGTQPKAWGPLVQAVQLIMVGPAAYAEAIAEGQTEEDGEDAKKKS